MEKILIIEDDKDIQDLLKIYIEAEGYITLRAETANTGIKLLSENHVDLVVLDLMLPDIDGLTLCRNIRKKYNCPIIMVTAKSQNEDKIIGLKSGADDYITKPFNLLEVMARIEAQLRRYKEYDRKPVEEKTIYYKGLVVDRKSRTAALNGSKVKLTPTEFNILEILLLNKGEVMSGEKLFYLLNQEEYYSKSTNTMAVHIRNLRDKLKDSPENPQYIKTVWGVGYIVEE